MIKILTPHQIELMRHRGKVMQQIFIGLRDVIKSGVSTKDIDTWVYEFIINHDCKPSCLNYMGYPASVCTSVNDVVVHGIPSETKILKDGDIISVDICVNYKGIHTDACRTYFVGNVSPEAKRLVEITKQSFFEAIKGLKAGDKTGDIGYKVQSFVEKNGYSVVRDLQGHGIGTSIHQDPGIPNFGKPGTGVTLKENMAICIEPMVNMGGYKVVFEKDGWTCRTKDGSLAAHYENTMLVCSDHVELLTLEEDYE